VRDLRLSWSEAADRIRSSPAVLVLSELDGTLVPMAEKPGLAHVSDTLKKLLRRLAQHPKVAAGVISGHALGDVATRVGVPGLWYVGNHGYEICTPAGFDVRFYDPTDLRSVDDFEKDIAKATEQIPGVHLEPKGPILALQYRQVDPACIADIEKLFLEVLDRHHERLQMARGRYVLEARLRAPCTKASAIRHIRKDTPAGALPIYFGDDLTDHDAFRELRDSGLTVSVGDGEPPLAHYALPDPDAVAEVLGLILSVLNKT
jgi:trehalose-phosphatase